ncbi:MAG: hypothetical protein ACTSYA_02810, partial [Candidatus Kariarchaeaceae archaeon]
ITSTPSDFTVESDYTGQTISWIVTDLNPDTYTIELDGGEVVSSTAWTTGVAITYNIPEGFEIGDYTYTVTFTDIGGYFVTDSVTLTVSDTVDPIITVDPNDLAVEEDYTGRIISWTATDFNPDTYTIEFDGTEVVSPTAWLSGEAITYNIPDGLAIGDYIYTVNFTDDGGNSVTESVTFTVSDTTNPYITNAPSDITVEFDYTGESLSWTATDLNPTTYTIELQGTGVLAGPSSWTSGVAIIYNLMDGLTAGDYIFTVTFTDAYGNSVTDTVTFTVEAAPTDDPTTDPPTVPTTDPTDSDDGGDSSGISGIITMFTLVTVISVVKVYKKKRRNN